MVLFRVAHCQRGPHVQVKGSLILISSDIKHSLEKILPINQQIVPVKFKRKLSYDGYYLGEFVDTKKVRLFFEFFKKNNHLYKDAFLQNDIIEEFESKLELESDQILEACSNTNHEEMEEGDSDVDELQDEIDLLAEEVVQDTHDTDGVENVSPDKDSEDVVPIHQQNSTLFMNKYEEDTDALTVANRIAKLICHLEKEKVLTVDPLEEIDLDHINDNNIDFYEPKDELCDSEGELDSDEDSDYMPTTDDISEDELEFYSDASLSSDESSNSSSEDESTQENQQLQQGGIDVQKLAENLTKKTKEKMTAVCVAPGEHGEFVNWKEDVYLEEKCFPELFPRGCGGYLSTCLSTGKNIGFANYARQKIKSADPKFRDNQTYVFFLLLVKELVELNSCQSTYLRQARNTPGLTKQCLDSTRIHNLTRYNRSFSVFKKCRGTSAYYEAAKKNLMATIRQQGAPNIFVTLTSAEYQWHPLVKSCYEAKYRKPATQEEIDNMSEGEKSRLITESVTLTTLHFEKRINKLIRSFMKPGWFQDPQDPLIKEEDTEDDDLEDDTKPSYFYRIEFQVVSYCIEHWTIAYKVNMKALLFLQARGAPHVHLLAWIQDKNKKMLPTISNTPKDQIPDKLLEIARVHDQIISCNLPGEELDEEVRRRIEKYQVHFDSFTCFKKKKTITIKKNEGHGISKPPPDAVDLIAVPICRFGFPKFPMDKTVALMGYAKDEDKEIVTRGKKDLSNIRKFLLRQTYCPPGAKREDQPGYQKLANLTFPEFLNQIGMFEGLEGEEEEVLAKARRRYENAVRASIRGEMSVFPKRDCASLFVNNYNKKLMEHHGANQDLTYIGDAYGAAGYVCGYLTKAESGQSALLKKIDEEYKHLPEQDKLRKFASALDKSREVSIQEAIYRLLGLPLARFSVKVKYINTSSPQHRDGLLRNDLDTVSDSDSVFYPSIHQYYEHRPKTWTVTEKGKEKEVQGDSICLADFVSLYDHAASGKLPKGGIPFEGMKGFFRRRGPGIFFFIDMEYTELTFSLFRSEGCIAVLLAL